MPIDPFESNSDSVTAPSQNCFTVLPSDTELLPIVPKAIYVGTGGDITLRSIGGLSDVTFANLPAGFVLDVRVMAIRASGTTASQIVGLA